MEEATQLGLDLPANPRWEAGGKDVAQTSEDPLSSRGRTSSRSPGDLRARGESSVSTLLVRKIYVQRLQEEGAEA